eukprot:m.330158 g.330158  ORF g.330158 m.330158 type:complete len:600 (+) comp20457_c0_seq5:233-2032(+)
MGDVHAPSEAEEQLLRSISTVCSSARKFQGARPDARNPCTGGGSRSESASKQRRDHVRDASRRPQLGGTFVHHTTNAPQRYMEAYRGVYSIEVTGPSQPPPLHRVSGSHALAVAYASTNVHGSGAPSLQRLGGEGSVADILGFPGVATHHAHAAGEPRPVYRVPAPSADDASGVTPAQTSASADTPRNASGNASEVHAPPNPQKAATPSAIPLQVSGNGPSVGRVQPGAPAAARSPNGTIPSGSPAARRKHALREKLHGHAVLKDRGPVQNGLADTALVVGPSREAAADSSGGQGPGSAIPPAEVMPRGRRHRTDAPRNLSASKKRQAPVQKLVTVVKPSPPSSPRRGNSPGYAAPHRRKTSLLTTALGAVVTSAPPPQAAHTRPPIAITGSGVGDASEHPHVRSSGQDDAGGSHGRTASPITWQPTLARDALASPTHQPPHSSGSDTILDHTSRTNSPSDHSSPALHSSPSLGKGDDVSSSNGVVPSPSLYRDPLVAPLPRLASKGSVLSMHRHGAKVSTLPKKSTTTVSGLLQRRPAPSSHSLRSRPIRHPKPLAHGTAGRNPDGSFPSIWKSGRKRRPATLPSTSKDKLRSSAFSS